MHWIKMGDVPEIWRRLEEVGITTVQACGDSARNVLCCPVSGLGDEEVIDAYPVARAISNYFTGNREYANLPRKFKMSVTGCLEDCAQAEINDIGMLPRGSKTTSAPARRGWSLRRPEDGLGHRRLRAARGRRGDHTRHSAGLWRARKRENRWINRMRYLVQELGPRRRAREARLRGARARWRGPHRRYRGDHVGVHPQKCRDGSRSVPTTLGSTSRWGG